MKKSNLLTFMFLSCVILFLLLFEPISKEDAEKKSDTKENNIYSNDTEVVEEKSKEHTEDILENEFLNHSASANGTASSNDLFVYEEEVDMSVYQNSLFIGDSRTVGLMEYAQIEEADFFCAVGMNVFNVQKEKVSIKNYGKIQLAALLEQQQYERIFLMLGINELGYSLDSVLEKYEELIALLKESQPEAVIVLQANLHVTQKRSESDKVINNEAINLLNDSLRQLSDKDKIFYIDVNPLFDDAFGNLDSEKSADDAHLYAKYYKVWGKWIAWKLSL